MDLLTIGSIHAVIGIQVLTTVLVIIGLDDLIFALGVIEKGTAAILVLTIHFILG